MVILLEDIREEMKLNANITKVLSEAKSNFSDDEHEVKLSIVHYIHHVKDCDWLMFTLFCVTWTPNTNFVIV